MASETIILTKQDKRDLDWKWSNVRADRNSRLAETDWWALTDRYCNNAMQIYRQKLRDVPADNADPDFIMWPIKP